jgi:radical SAM superfamily enzyme YgiQ (UPF0313 family)
MRSHQEMKRKILLFNPRSEFYAMPLGLLAVGSALDLGRFEVKIFDARIDGQAAGKILSEASQAACVGMTVFSGPPIGDALQLARQFKSRFPALPIVWGGWHPSILPEQCIQSGVVDAVVIGQGEPAFCELMECIDSPEQWMAIDGLCVARNGRAARTNPRPLARMDQFPPMRYEQLDVERYFTHKGVRQVDYSSSRGCPYKCTFCADPMVYRNKWTGLPANRVLSDLMALYERYRIEEVSFLDDDLFASLKRIQELVEVFIQANIPFRWKGTARADELCRLPETFFDRLRLAGCSRINVGAESGSQKILDQIKKQYRVDQILTAACRASRAGIRISHSFIVGFPGETEEDFQATLGVIKAIRQMHPGLEASIFFYSPYPGTELVRELEQRGLRLPAKLEDWRAFDIEGAWLPRNDRRFVRRVKNLNFYLRHAYAQKDGSLLRRILQTLSRIRCEHDRYEFPVEPYLAEAWKYPFQHQAQTSDAEQ